MAALLPAGVPLPQPGAPAASWPRTVREAALEHELAALRKEVRTRFEKEQSAAMHATNVTAAFAEKTMATIAAWFTGQACFVVISENLPSAPAERALQTFVARSIYAAFVTVAVPFASWGLRNEAVEPTTWRGDQVALVKACLPMLLAWGWRDWGEAYLDLSEQPFWPEVTLALAMTLLIALAEAAPCHRRSVEAVNARGKGDTLCARLGTVPGQVGLAVGFAWNSVCKWGVVRVQSRLTAPLFILMVQVWYTVLTSAAITYLTVTWSGIQDRRAKKAAEAAGGKQADSDAEEEASLSGSEVSFTVPHRPTVQDMVKGVKTIGVASGAVLIDALSFVYGWAVLDTMNALYFTYLAGCASPKACSYQSNFVFALAVTYVFSRLVFVMQQMLEHRGSSWDKAASNLLTNSMSLNVGWTWMNYCATAIASAKVSSGLDTLAVYLVCWALAWLTMSLLHHTFQGEKRDWLRALKEGPAPGLMSP